MNTVYVVSYVPHNDKCSVGGFDWFWDRDVAISAFYKELNESKDSRIIKMVEYSTIHYVAEDITKDIDNNFSDVAYSARPIMHYTPGNIH